MKGLVCVRFICECVVEALYVPPEFGGVSVVCDSVEKLLVTSKSSVH